VDAGKAMTAAFAAQTERDERRVKVWWHLFGRMGQYPRMNQWSWRPPRRRPYRSAVEQSALYDTYLYG
jgi:hypothetical protein